MYKTDKAERVLRKQQVQPIFFLLAFPSCLLKGEDSAGCSDQTAYLHKVKTLFMTLHIWERTQQLNRNTNSSFPKSTLTFCNFYFVIVQSYTLNKYISALIRLGTEYQVTVI